MREKALPALGTGTPLGWSEGVMRPAFILFAFGRSSLWYRHFLILLFLLKGRQKPGRMSEGY